MLLLNDLVTSIIVSCYETNLHDVLVLTMSEHLKVLF